jgi:hypothetical protein
MYASTLNSAGLDVQTAAADELHRAWDGNADAVGEPPEHAVPVQAIFARDAVDDLVIDRPCRRRATRLPRRSTRHERIRSKNVSPRTVVSHPVRFW